ncbi:MAG: DUF115 domain-containing protein [Acidobacteria bacterium]|nr:DUF115 domain-containing protein [Acidobacteriota bacterium]
MPFTPETPVVSPPVPTLARNLAVLERSRPWALRRILDGLPAAPCPRVVVTPSGEPALRLPSGEYLDDPADPRAAARRTVAALSRRRDSAVLLFGFGSGYLAEEALAATPANRAVVVAVIDPGAFLAALGGRDLSSLLGEPRLLLALGDLREILAALPRAADAEVLVEPSLLRAAAGALAPLADMARELGAQSRSARNQRAFILDNIERNLPRIVRVPGIGALSRTLSGGAAIITAPGPSLAGQLGLLARPERPFLVALDTSLRALASAGVRPDLVVTVDGTPANLAKFEGVALDAPLVFSEGARPEIVAAARAAVFACERGGLLDRAHPLFGAAGCCSSCGSVLHAALDVLLAAGARPVVLAGADLALTGGAAHAGSAAPGSAWREVAARGGGTVATSESLWRHRRRILRRIAREPAGAVLDATAAGAALPGVPRTDLAAWLDAAPAPAREQRVLDLDPPRRSEAAIDEALAAAAAKIAAARSGE